MLTALGIAVAPWMLGWRPITPAWQRTTLHAAWTPPPRAMSAGRPHGEPSASTKAAADVLVKGLGDLLRAQLTGADEHIERTWYSSSRVVCLCSTRAVLVKSPPALRMRLQVSCEPKNKTFLHEASLQLGSLCIPSSKNHVLSFRKSATHEIDCCAPSVIFAHWLSLRCLARVHLFRWMYGLAYFMYVHATLNI